MNECLQVEEETSKECARNEFLAEIRNLDCAGAMFFDIGRTSYSTPEVKASPPMLLGVNLAGLHFFDKAPCGYRDTVQLKHLESCSERRSSGRVKVLFKDDGDRWIEVETDDTFTLQGVIEAHIEYHKRDAATLFRQAFRRRGHHGCGLENMNGRILETRSSESISRGVPVLSSLLSSRTAEAVSQSSAYSTRESEATRSLDYGSSASGTDRRRRNRDSSSIRRYSRTLKHVIYIKRQKSASKRKKSSPEPQRSPSRHTASKCLYKEFGVLWE